MKLLASITLAGALLLTTTPTKPFWTETFMLAGGSWGILKLKRLFDQQKPKGTPFEEVTPAGKKRTGVEVCNKCDVNKYNLPPKYALSLMAGSLFTGLYLGYQLKS